jgi:putative ABC transport system substrate-binding protein
MAIYTRRREFIVVLAGAAAWPLAGHAQQSAMPVIGGLGSESREAENPRIIPFRQSLEEAGYVDGQNLKIEYRLADGRYDQLAVTSKPQKRSDLMSPFRCSCASTK